MKRLHILIALAFLIGFVSMAIYGAGDHVRCRYAKKCHLDNEVCKMKGDIQHIIEGKGKIQQPRTDLLNLF